MLMIFTAATLLLLNHVGSAPVHHEHGLEPSTPIPILVDERIPIDSFGGYGFRIASANGIEWTEESAPAGPLNQRVTNGAYSFTHPDGTAHHLSYSADASGFHPQSSMIPTPYPLTPWQLEQVQFAEEQRQLQAQTSSHA
ncbi:cuticle protein AM1199-like [Macrobrachium rosenbergii]|uniref:cuticle protein AM1199-like n=1 Tax=Macrobrachium rosenbergii TaxID=79674 RepID=UPI0034D70364